VNGELTTPPAPAATADPAVAGDAPVGRTTSASPAPDNAAPADHAPSDHAPSASPLTARPATTPADAARPDATPSAPGPAASSAPAATDATPSCAAALSATVPEPRSGRAPKPGAPALPRRRTLRLAAPRGRAPFSVRIDARALGVGVALLAGCLVVAAVTLSTGDYHVPLPDVFRVLGGGGTPAEHFVVESLRLPRLLTGLLAGAALGTGGALFQSLSRNPLGSPDVVGFDTGAATGALVVILVLHGTSGQSAVGAALGGLATAVAVYLLAMRRGVHGGRLVLIGIAVSAMLTSVNSYLLTRASVTDAQSASVWLVGSLNGRGWEQVRPVALALLVLLPAAGALARPLRMLEMGDDTAAALGTRPEPVRFAAIVVGVGLAAVATSSAGPIGFVALSAPQIARRLTGVPGPGVLSSALTGALLLSAADLAGQRVFPTTQLPVGVMTGAIGGGYLAWLLAREWRGGRG
jgi:iron complex transport system permease protein